MGDIIIIISLHKEVTKDSDNFKDIAYCNLFLTILNGLHYHAAKILQRNSRKVGAGHLGREVPGTPAASLATAVIKYF